MPGPTGEVQGFAGAATTASDYRITTGVSAQVIPFVITPVRRHATTRGQFTPYSPKPFPHYTCSATDSACYIGGQGLEIGSGGGSGGSGVRGG
eukprot:jgi/Tetstr1/443311/TSEL_031326.t1